MSRPHGVTSLVAPLTALLYAPALALFALLERVTGGQFRRYIVDGNLNDWAWARVDFFWQPFWALLHWSIPLGAVALALGLATRRSQLPLLYALGAAATSLTIGMSFTVTSGRRIYLQPFEFSQLALQGVWDQGPLLADVRRGHFRAVVLRFRLEDDPSWRGERINPALLGALREHYELDAEFGDYFVYRFRAPPHP